MADTGETGYLSIGEVLGLLLEEFPDVTISKIRFLESQGLISPERTSSGYRKFYDDDVELLRVILTEQQQNYLPLRVIKDRLASGEIDPTGDHLRPNGPAPDDETAPPTAEYGAAVREPAPAEPNGTGGADSTSTTTDEPGPGADAEGGDDEDGHDDTGDVERAEVPGSSVAAHPAARGRGSTGVPAPTAADDEAGEDDAGEDDAGDGPDDDHTPAAPAMLPGVLLDRAELCAMVGMADEELAELESFGIVTPRDGAGGELYGDDAVEIARPACELMRLGIDARHLRTWRTGAEREASLYEQLVTPRLRQRNPQARTEALERLRRLDRLGGTLRAALTRHALRHHFES